MRNFFTTLMSATLIILTTSSFTISLNKVKAVQCSRPCCVVRSNTLAYLGNRDFTVSEANFIADSAFMACEGL